MKVLLFGGTGRIGLAIGEELIARGHDVTVAARRGHDGTVIADVTDPVSVAALSIGHDAVASAVGPRHGVDDDEAILVGSARALIIGLRESGVRRLVVVGGAGSLAVEPGVALVETPEFPSMWRANALAQAEALRRYREVDDLDWTYVSPAAEIEPGPRTGRFRVGGDDLLVDAAGRSRISIPDYAVGFVDELERADSVRRRITMAY